MEVAKTLCHSASCSEVFVSLEFLDDFNMIRMDRTDRALVYQDCPRFLPRLRARLLPRLRIRFFLYFLLSLLVRFLFRRVLRILLHVFHHVLLHFFSIFLLGFRSNGTDPLACRFNICALFLPARTNPEVGVERYILEIYDTYLLAHTSPTLSKPPALHHTHRENIPSHLAWPRSGELVEMSPDAQDKLYSRNSLDSHIFPDFSSLANSMRRIRFMKATSTYCYIVAVLSVAVSMNAQKLGKSTRSDVSNISRKRSNADNPALSKRVQLKSRTLFGSRT